MGKLLGLGLAAGGIVLVVYGASLGTDSEIQIIAVMGGFVATAAGIGSLLLGSGGYEPKTSGKEASDKPTKVRLAGVAVALASLALPYASIPLEAGVERTSYSFVGLVTVLTEGVEIELTLLIFMSVVLAGAFASILHHVGGYVIIFGAAGYGYIAVELLGAEPLEVFLNEFQIGVYIALVGAGVIIASSFLKYETTESESSIYGGGR